MILQYKINVWDVSVISSCALLGMWFPIHVDGLKSIHVNKMALVATNIYGISLAISYTIYLAPTFVDVYYLMRWQAH